MSTDSGRPRKNRFVLVTLRIGFFALPIILPMRCAHEIVEGFMDLLSLFRWADSRAYCGLHAIDAALIAVKDYGPLDLVDVDVKSAKERVKIKILTR